MRYQPSTHSFRNRAARAAWGFVWVALYRPSPRLLHGWRRFLLRLFGARVGRGAHPYPSARIWAPWNLDLGGNSSLADDVDCYCVDRITIGAGVTVSQYAFLCTATHDYENPRFPLVTAPIWIGDHAWICAGAFVGPGVSVGVGAVVGARSAAFRDVPAWTVVAGTPAKFVKPRHVPGISPPAPDGVARAADDVAPASGPTVAATPASALHEHSGVRP